MQHAITVGYDASDGSADALAVARALAGATRRQLVLVHVRPPRDGGSDERERMLARRAAAALAVAPLGDEAGRDVVCERSVAVGLRRHAIETEAAAIVVGCPDYTDPGRIDPGLVAANLLHGSPCAVAIAPRGYAGRADRRFRRILVAYTPSDEARSALRAAADLARASDATLRVVSVVGAVPSWTYEITGYASAVRTTVEEELDRSLRALASTVETEGVVLAGDPVALLLAESREWGADLIVAGSRGYGPARRVLLGSVSSGLLEGAQVPVLVTPRGATVELAAIAYDVSAHRRTSRRSSSAAPTAASAMPTAMRPAQAPTSTPSRMGAP